MAFRLPVFSAIRMNDVAISLIRARNREKFGVFASMTPLRFENGSFQGMRGGHLYEMPRLYDEQNRPLLYVLSIYLPRFTDLSLSDKIRTLVHELYHIGPKFDGDIRRFDGRCFAHGSTRKEYDRIVKKYADQWLASDPPPEIWNFLRYDFAALCAKFGGVTGSKVVLPPMKLIK